jgi:glycosyltransferase involved in cell wall biosynthesis
MYKIIVIQRIAAEYREGFFDLLSEKTKLSLISYTKKLGKTRTIPNLTSKKYFKHIVSFHFRDYVFYPFLLLYLFIYMPQKIVTEGGKNTINNISILLYSIITKNKYYIWDLGKYYLNEKSSFISMVYNVIYTFILKRSDGLIVYNSKSKEYFMQKSLSVPITIINNTIDTRRIDKILLKYDPREHKKHKDKFSKYHRILLYVGSINSNKNLEVLPELLNQLGELYCLIIIGDGAPDYVNYLRNKFPNNAYFEGYKTIEECYYYYMICDFSILPGLGGLSINQSMAFGVPVLVNRADGSEFDLVIDYQTGYKYKNIDDLAIFIKSRSSEDIALMKNNSIRLINEDYSVEKMVKLFMSAIK